MYSYLSKQINDLAEEVSKIKVDFKKQHNFLDIINCMKTFYSGINTKLIHEIELLKFEMQPLYKIISSEFTSFCEFYNLNENFRTKFDQAEANLWAKKEDLFKNPNEAKWKISKECSHTFAELSLNKILAFKYMRPQETIDTLKLKEYYGYVCNRIKEEHYRLLNSIVYIIQKSLGKISDSIYSKSNQVR